VRSIKSIFGVFVKSIAVFEKLIVDGIVLKSGNNSIFQNIINTCQYRLGTIDLYTTTEHGILLLLIQIHLAYWSLRLNYIICNHKDPTNKYRHVIIRVVNLDWHRRELRQFDDFSQYSVILSHFWRSIVGKTGIYCLLVIYYLLIQSITSRRHDKWNMISTDNGYQLPG